MEYYGIFNLIAMASNLVADCKLLVMPFVPSSVLAPSSEARSPDRSFSCYVRNALWCTNVVSKRVKVRVESAKE